MDLVRGSTFPKAKPKQSLVQVLYLSILRYFFLPLFSKWWVKETSAKVFVVLLSLYFLQMINWAIYSLHVRSVSDDNKEESNEEESSIDLCELLIPSGLSLLLCFNHSQIVATSVFPLRSASNKRRHKVNFGKNRTSNYDKLKRKKKTFRQRVNNCMDIENSKGYDSDDEQSVILHHNKIVTNSVEVPNECIDSSSSSILATSPASHLEPASIRRRRNVNWDLTSNIRLRPVDINGAPAPRSTEDDGFESFTGKSSSGEDLRNNLKKESNSDTDTLKNSERSTPIKMSRKDEKIKHSSDSEEEGALDDSLTPSSSTHFETTDGEYMIGVTSNSESDQCEDYHSDDDDNVPTKILNPNDLSERVTVTVWTKHFEAKKAEMNAFDISSAIIYRVDSIPETYDYVYIGMAFSIILALTPAYCRLCDVSREINSTSTHNPVIDLPNVEIAKDFNFMQLAFGQSFWIQLLLTIAIIQRLVLAFIFFFLLAVAERTFKQRFVKIC